MLQLDDALLVARFLVVAQAGTWRMQTAAAAAAAVVQLIIHRRLEARRTLVQGVPASADLAQATTVSCLYVMTQQWQKGVAGVHQTMHRTPGDTQKIASEDCELTHLREDRLLCLPGEAVPAAHPLRGGLWWSSSSRSSAARCRLLRSSLTCTGTANR